MKKRIKTKWLEALRSGKYKQAEGALRKDESFCCLGVLCELYREEVGGQWTDEGRFLNQNIYLPRPVLDWAGLPDNNPELPEQAVDDKAIEYSEESLAYQNDHRADFQRIADLIEKYL